ncbi:hypothetical protein LSH36_660g05025, partial [Paralvinella palmiformis]
MRQVPVMTVIQTVSHMMLNSVTLIHVLTGELVLGESVQLAVEAAIVSVLSRVCYLTTPYWKMLSVSSHRNQHKHK